MSRKIPNPAPDGYLRVCWSTSGPIYSKWVGEGPEPKAKAKERKS
jgi:hypothetical protein